MEFTTATEEATILHWIQQQQHKLFPDIGTFVKGFYWRTPTSQRGRSSWAGWYGWSSITLNPEFFSGSPDPSLAIQDTLLHELCHHIQAVKYANNVPPHGKEFREIAYYVNGVLGRDAVTIYHSLSRTPEGQDAERAQRKALALLARTTSSNEHEAALAAAKYAAFTAANNIVLDGHSAVLASNLPDVICEHLWTAKKTTKALLTIIGAVAETHACVFTFIRSYDACTKFHFYGRSIKLCQAYDMIEYLTQAIERVVKNEQKQSSEAKGRSYWGAFREGVAIRVAKALRDDHQRRLSEGVVASNGISHIPGLVLMSAFEKERKAACDLVRDMHPNIRASSDHRGSNSHEGRRAGYEAGKNVSVAKQTTGRGTLLLAG